MAPQQPPPLPSWAPPGATWSNPTITDPNAGVAPRPRLGRALVLTVLVLLLPLSVVLAIGLAIEHYAFPRYDVVTRDSLLGLPHVGGSADAQLTNSLPSVRGRKLAVQLYGADPSDILIVESNIGVNLFVHRQMNEVARTIGGTSIDVPTDGYGGLGRCFHAEARLTFCVFANDDSLVMVGEQRAQSLVVAAARAREVHKLVLHKKKYRL